MKARRCAVMTFPVPGSAMIPTLGVPSTLVSIDAHAVAAAAACVGASLLLAWTVTLLQRHQDRTMGTHEPSAVLPLARHAA
jgi:hypothetical protein